MQQRSFGVSFAEAGLLEFQMGLMRLGRAQASQQQHPTWRLGGLDISDMEMIEERKVGGVVEADLPRMKGGDPAVERG